MHIAIKGFIGATTLGGIATGSYFALKPDNTNKEVKAQEKKQSLLEIMKETAEFEALSTKEGEDVAQWQELIKKYHDSETNKNEKKLTLEGITSVTDGNEAENIKKLQGNCEKLFKKTEDFEKDKQTVTNWCNKKSSLITANKQPAT